MSIEDNSVSHEASATHPPAATSAAEPTSVPTTVQAEGEPLSNEQPAKAEVLGHDEISMEIDGEHVVKKRKNTKRKPASKRGQV